MPTFPQPSVKAAMPTLPQLPDKTVTSATTTAVTSSPTQPCAKKLCYLCASKDKLCPFTALTSD